MLDVLVKNSGHNVPGDQPERAFTLINSFINDIPLQHIQKEK